MRFRLPLVAFAAVLLLVGACGGGGHGGHASSSGDRATRNINVTMVDTAFEPSRLEVERDETVRFLFRNQGKVAHDAFIGDEAAQAMHEADMGGEAMEHDGEDAITVEPGESADLTYTFANATEVFIGCHQPGHYAAGMKLAVAVR